MSTAYIFANYCIRNQTSELGDLVSNDDEVLPDAEVEEKQLHETLVDMLDILSDREQEIIRKRFGLVDGEFHTLENIAKEFGISERIRSCFGFKSCVAQLQ